MIHTNKCKVYINSLWVNEMWVSLCYKRVWDNIAKRGGHWVITSLLTNKCNKFLSRFLWFYAPDVSVIKKRNSLFIHKSLKSTKGAAEWTLTNKPTLLPCGWEAETADLHWGTCHGLPTQAVANLLLPPPGNLSRKQCGGLWDGIKLACSAFPTLNIDVFQKMFFRRLQI